MFIGAADSEANRKIKVEIKPFSPNGTTPTDNVDDIRKSIEGLRLSPTSSVSAHTYQVKCDIHTILHCHTLLEVGVLW